MAALSRFRYETPSRATSSRVVDELLDNICFGLADPARAPDAMHVLFQRLGDLWSAAGRERWSEIVQECRRHRLHALLEQDPFTSRARAKPRGSADDAVVFDYIYRGLAAPEVATVGDLGQAIFDYTAGMSAIARAVRARRDMLAAHIDAAADRVHRPRILAVACGHLREAALSFAVRTGAVGALVAVAQDRESLAVVNDAYGTVPEIEVVPGTAGDLLAGKLELSNFDLIYAAGLYDYLPDEPARALTTNLACRLAPGGRLLVGNLSPAPHVVGFMEALMDWPLVWRTQAQVAALADVQAGLVASCTSFVDATETIAYLELTRR
jgi:SAM-dependent methyltransferase